MTKKSNFKVRPLPLHNKRGVVHFENGKTIESNEIDIVKKLTYFGYDIVCKQESNVPYQHTADIVWKNEIWELKSLTGGSRYTIRNNLRSAKKQSKNIILDISHSKIQMSSAINHSREYMVRNKTIQKIMIIDKMTYCITRKGLL